MSIESMELVWPAVQYLSGYVHALEQGWSPDNLRPQAASEQLANIAADPVRFVAEQVDRDAKGSPVILPDGSAVPRLPGYSHGFGMGNSAEQLVFAGNQELRTCRRIVWGHMATRWSHGSDGKDTQLAPCSCSCRKQEMRGCLR